jgi:hypothetical protein
MSERASILARVARLFGDDQYTLAPYKPVWVGWGEPKTVGARAIDADLSHIEKGLGTQQRAFLRSLLAGRRGCGGWLHANAYTAYRKEGGVDVFVCHAWVDPHTQLVTIQ